MMPMTRVTAGREGYLGHGRILRLSSVKFAQRTFLEFEDRSYTYSAFNAQVNVLAQWVASEGLRNEDRVLILSENSPGFVRAMFALGKLGVVAMPANTMLTVSDVSRLIDLTKPAHVLAGRLYYEKVVDAVGASSTPAIPVSVLESDDRVTPVQGSVLDVVGTALNGVGEPRPARPVQDEDPGVIFFTSGSTGTPKGIVKSYANVAWSAINHQISEPRRGGDREAFCLSLAGVAFANFVLQDVLAGATCVLEPAFDAARLSRTLAGRGITHIFLAPTMISALWRNRPESEFPTVRVVETSFEFPIETRRMAVRMFPNASILWSFGSTEATKARTPPQFLLNDVSCVGYAGGLDEYRIEPGTPLGEPGEVQSFGPTVMSSYLQGDDANGVDGTGVLHDGWFPTGDLGTIGEAGALYFAGRAKDMIKTGGANVFAIDVEAALTEHPDVRNAAVIGLTEPYWGEIVVAVLEVDDPETASVDAIHNFATERLAAFKRPKQYFFVGELPKNPTGKVAKGVLKDRVVAGDLEAISPKESGANGPSAERGSQQSTGIPHV
jgi:fatty-acyl-CoA synthase